MLRVYSVPFSNLCKGIVGNGEVRPASMLGSDVLGNNFGECYIITFLRDVTQLTFIVTADQR